MRPILMAGLTAGLLAWTGVAVAQSGNKLQVQGWAATCSTCHGTDGRAVPNSIPLAGKSGADMYEKMLDYKNDVRPSTVMGQITKGYSDEQLGAIAAWFAAQKK
ncbi:MAG: c-type cytochrome [Ottowia sp.]|nr:c-type cytochrome [Ottowia sp.]